MKSVLTTTSLLSTLLLACAPDAGGQGSGSCPSGKCDSLEVPDSEVEDSPCDGTVVDHSGRGHQKVAGRLGDPFAQSVLRAGDSCPTTLDDIMDKLRELDREGSCDSDDPRAGIKTRVVSETAQATGIASNYRAVVTRQCGDRDEFGMVFSIFGLGEPSGPLPQDGIEVMAFDETEGVFNYYKTNGGRINWLGNSRDMLRGPDGEDRECARCHTGGGLIMKELDTPWVHWEGHMDIPGSGELVDNHENLGTKTGGANMERIVKAGNRAWNDARIDHLLDQGRTDELLRPLFCETEVNLDNGADFESPVDGEESSNSIKRIGIDSLLSPQLKAFGTINVSHDDYRQLLGEVGSRVPGVQAAIDTVFDYVFIERAHADTDFVDKLVERELLDTELVKDIMLVDFTRPVFSEDRCALLEFVPSIESASIGASGLRDGLIANLEDAGHVAGDGTPAGQLLINLNRQGGHDEVVETFTGACSELDAGAFLTNAYTVTSLNRTKARRLPVFEFQATMPTDNLSPAAGTRLHPTTCELTESFVPVALSAGECCRVCGENSQACGDGCISLDATCNAAPGCACEG